MTGVSTVQDTRAGHTCYIREVYRSCYEAMQAGSTSNGRYTLYLQDMTTKFTTTCDMSGGGWTLVINVPSSTKQNTYITTGAAGDWSNFNGGWAGGWAKLSDANINFMNGLSPEADYFKYTCNTLTRYIRRSGGFVSLQNQGGWELDRNLDGQMDCDADRSGYIFADYPDNKLSGATAGCSIDGHTDYGAKNSNQGGCYDAVSRSWGQHAQIWVK